MSAAVGSAIVSRKGKILDIELEDDFPTAERMVQRMNEKLDSPARMRWVVARIETIEPPRKLQQGDVKLGDRVRMKVAPTGPTDNGGYIEGIVAEMASNGGVVGVNIGGTWFSAGLTSVELLDADR